MNREEWLKERESGLGASDAAAYMGESKWKTNVRLWEEKTGLVQPDPVGGPAVDYGNAAEPLLRSLWTLDHLDYTVDFTPHKIIRNKDKPYIFATPDGELMERRTGKSGGLEIKTTEIRSAALMTQWEGRIPDNYFIQVLHQMLATGWEFVILTAQIKHYDKNGDMLKTTRDYRINRDEVSDDLKSVEAEATKFWNCVQKKIRPALKLPGI